MDLKKLKKWLAGGRLKMNGNQDTPASSTDGREAAIPHEPPVTPSRCGETDAPARGAETAAPVTEPRRPPGRQRPVSRQGIPILKPDEDLTRCFSHPSHASDATADTSNAPAGKGRNPKRRRQRHRPRSDPPRNRLGIRQLKTEEDVWGHFLSAENAEREASPPPGAPTPNGEKPASRASSVDIATDRHGIPRLDDRADLQFFFEGMVTDGEEDGDLGDVFRRTLQQDAQDLMKQKSGGVWAPRRLSLKEQLRRYPAPQAQLDLHGATALKARQRADSFIRTAMADGLFTLRLIVGKGLHSEGGAVLPDVIEDLLLALRRESVVLTFSWEKGIKRKSGAVIVYLTPPF